MGVMHERASEVLAQLSRSADVESRGIGDILATITETAARTLGVARVSVWLYDAPRSAITCIEDFRARDGHHASGQVLRVADSPRYFEALEHARGVVTLDAIADPRTMELRPYLHEHGVTALLDVPLLRSGHVVGVVCHEHVGGDRRFDEDDLVFATAIGDLVSLALETDGRQRAERELARLRRLDTVGWVAAGVAHDLRNLLTIVFTNVDLLRSPRTARPRALDDIERAAVRARDLCTLLLQSSGQTPETRERLDAREVVEDLLRLVERSRPAAVAMDWRPTPGLPRIEASPAGLHRVVLNLVTNALEALPPEGGRITVTLRAGTPQDAPSWDFRVDRQGLLVALEVRDDGRGMDPATAARAGDPFFTTKTTGVGHGFGLATVLGTIRAHQGALHLSSRPGEGTAVTAWFPVAP
jgi:signal transduction histidine kinase